MDATRRIALLGDQKGFALVYIALLIFVLFGTLGLAVDISHLYVVRGELQNCADAAALAGAWSLYRDPANPGATPTLDFERARAAAASYIQQNSSDGVALSDGNIEVGYWSRLDPEAPLSPVKNDPANQREAVRVTVSRSSGNNGGPVGNFFIKVLDATKDKTPVSSRPSVALSGYIGGVPGGQAFPIALSSCMTDYYFLHSHSDPPPTFKTNTPYTPVGTPCETAQWTSLTENTNADRVISDFMKYPDTSPALSSGESIWIATGVMNNLFNNKNAGAYVGKNVIVPIVTGDTGVLSKSSTNGQMPIQGFATIHIVSVKNGSNPYVEAYFVDYSVTYPGTQPGGSVSNTVSPPLIVQ
ncbi:MAG TPA: pilus assembly protein TadG-related protein [Desulfuromonadaceae bacterium]|jgi:Flp pilus assembly protein TadG